MYRFSSLVKQNKKAKICFVIHITGERKLFFYIYAVIVKQKKKALLITTPATALMLAAGVIPLVPFDSLPMSFTAMTFTVLSPVGNAGQNLAPPVSEIVAGEDADFSSSLQLLADRGNNFVPMAESALGGAITIGQEVLLTTINSPMHQEIYMLDSNWCKMLGGKEGVDCGLELQMLVHRIKYKIWAKDHE